MNSSEQEILLWYKQSLDCGTREVLCGTITKFKYRGADSFGFIDDAFFFHPNNLQLLIVPPEGRLTTQRTSVDEAVSYCVKGTKVVFEKALATRGPKAYKWCPLEDVALAKYTLENLPKVTLVREDGARPVGKLSRGEYVRSHIPITDFAHLRDLLGPSGVKSSVMLRQARVDATGEILATSEDVAEFWANYVKGCKDACKRNGNGSGS